MALHPSPHTCVPLNIQSERPTFNFVLSLSLQISWCITTSTPAEGKRRRIWQNSSQLRAFKMAYIELELLHGHYKKYQTLHCITFRKPLQVKGFHKQQKIWRYQSFFILPWRLQPLQKTTGSRSQVWNWASQESTKCWLVGIKMKNNQCNVIYSPQSRVAWI